MIYWENAPPELEALLKKGMAYINAPKNSEVNVTFVSKDEIRQLNNEYRAKDTPTDVLSFMLSDPGVWEEPEFDPEIPTALGDIVICEEIAEEQAANYGHSIKREIGFLLIHGLLHLAGYDHMTPEDEAKMRKAQREILGELT